MYHLCPVLHYHHKHFHQVTSFCTNWRQVLPVSRWYTRILQDSQVHCVWQCGYTLHCRSCHFRPCLLDVHALLKRVPRRVGNLMPFYDPLQSCFKDQYRCFSAFYFVCRLVLLLIAVFLPECLNTACVVFLGFFLYFRPYKGPHSRAVNDPGDQQEDERLHQGCCFKKCVINIDDQNKNYDWINTSDATLLTTLCVVSVFSSQAPEGAGRNAGDKTIMAFSDHSQFFLLVYPCSC